MKGRGAGPTLIPHPGFLRRLVDEYETLRAQEAARGARAPSTRAKDLAYTLCVSTGTREVTQALEAARDLIEAATAPAQETAPLAD
ncbi:DUF5133 domain-containing protein [Streptomyces sp. NPDC005574]|uniref:DUF5133 domain-containing protein n=1 Tax=Streptomyces sp. NPDC005574 TaxID=3156891 RepID=UPI0033B67D45